MENGLVATEPRDGIAVARRLAHTVCQHPQHRIAGGMPERVVYLLEAVEVEKEQRHACAGSPPLPLPGWRNSAIGEIGESVIVSHIPDALTGQLLLCNVLG